VGGVENIQYCGSPIPLSFDELNNDKNILLVEFENGELTQVNEKIVPRFQPMHLITGDLKTIENEIKDLASSYKPPQVAWLGIEVSTQDYLNDLQQRIQSMVEGLPLEVLLLRRERKQSLQAIAKETKETLQELTPNEVFERRLSVEDWSKDDQKEKKLRLIKAFDKVVASLEDDGGLNAVAGADV